MIVSNIKDNEILKKVKGDYYGKLSVSPRVKRISDDDVEIVFDDNHVEEEK